MVKMDWTPSFGEKMKLAREAKKLEQSTNISNTITPIETHNEAPVKAVVTEPVKAEQPNLKAILERMERQDAEIAHLKLKNEDGFIKKEKYKWPRSYKISLWGGIPVISWKSTRKDPTKDFVYKNENGVYISNHYLDLSLANGEVVSVEVNTFDRDRQKTDPLPCTIQTDETGETAYIFNTPDYWKISLLSSFIN